MFKLLRGLFNNKLKKIYKKAKILHNLILPKRASFLMLKVKIKSIKFIFPQPKFYLTKINKNNV